MVSSEVISYNFYIIETIANLVSIYMTLILNTLIIPILIKFYVKSSLIYGEFVNLKIFDALVRSGVARRKKNYSSYHNISK